MDKLPEQPQQQTNNKTGPVPDHATRHHQERKKNAMPDHPGLRPVQLLPGPGLGAEWWCEIEQTPSQILIAVIVLI